MDERMVLLEGRDTTFAGSFVDHNLNDLAWWTQKHLGYASREAADMLDIEYGLFDRINAEAQNGDLTQRRRGAEECVTAETRRRRGKEGRAVPYLVASLVDCGEKNAER